MNKIRHYFSTNHITRGLGIALLSSSFIYLNYLGFSFALLNTILALCSLYFLLLSDKKIWFWYGIGIGLFWFWWVSLSLQHYGYAWGLPVGISLSSLLYGIILWSIAKLGDLSYGLHIRFPLIIKALGLLVLSYIHPFGFDWYKPELMFVESYLGIEKWQFTLILATIVLSIWKRNLFFLICVLFSYQPAHTLNPKTPQDIVLVDTHISVENKWDTSKHRVIFEKLFTLIDDAIIKKKKLIILPESVFPLFLNKNPSLLQMLKERSYAISIVTGGLYWDKQTPHNSTYIFNKGNITIANKVLLVPFGESNPLPNFLSDWVNKVFYDGAIDYVGGAEITDYTINGISYRNAICFEATSEALYVKDKEGNRPEKMIVLSNNGWFTPSIEPTLQKLLLLYYHKKYGTTIYHSVNMSESYILQNNFK